MKHIYPSLVLMACLTVAACGENNDAATRAADAEPTRNAQTSPTSAVDPGTSSDRPTGQVHSASGDITELSASSVTISHGPVESIGWPANTVTLVIQSPAMLEGLNVGDPVNFQFQNAGEKHVLTSITRAQQ